jgi:hypothetical protein
MRTVMPPGWDWLVHGRMLRPDHRQWRPVLRDGVAPGRVSQSPLRCGGYNGIEGAPGPEAAQPTTFERRGNAT